MWLPNRGKALRGTCMYQKFLSQWFLPCVLPHDLLNIDEIAVEEADEHNLAPSELARSVQ